MRATSRPLLCSSDSPPRWGHHLAPEHMCRRTWEMALNLVDGEAFWCFLGLNIAMDTCHLQE